MPHDVFINHATAGKLTAYAICSELESIGIRCWILPRDINIGTAWDQSISNAVAGCQIMIVVLSDYAGRSDRVERQLELAFNHGLIIIPFQAESQPVVYQSELPPDSTHWLDAVTPETALRLKSLCDLVGGFLRRRKGDPLPAEHQNGDKIAAASKNPATQDQVRTPAQDATEEPGDADSDKRARPVYQEADQSNSVDQAQAMPPIESSKSLPIRALLLMLLPFAVICGIGFWRAKERNRSEPARPVGGATTSITPLVAVKIRHQDQFASSNPGWGPLDANWTVAADKLQVTPLLNSSAVLINHHRGFTNAEISAEVAMSKGDHLDQLGGLIFWAKDYNDCYALVFSADGKFAVGRKLIGRWINPIAKTGNPAIKTGVGKTNMLRVKTEGNLITAFINDIQVATLSGNPPQGFSFIGLYGESAETTQNVWEFTNVKVDSLR